MYTQNTLAKICQSVIIDLLYAPKISNKIQAMLSVDVCIISD